MSECRTAWCRASPWCPARPRPPGAACPGSQPARAFTLLGGVRSARTPGRRRARAALRRWLMDHRADSPDECGHELAPFLVTLRRGLTPGALPGPENVHADEGSRNQARCRQVLERLRHPPEDVCVIRRDLRQRPGTGERTMNILAAASESPCGRSSPTPSARADRTALWPAYALMGTRSGPGRPAGRPFRRQGPLRGDRLRHRRLAPRRPAPLPVHGTDAVGAPPSPGSHGMPSLPLYETRQPSSASLFFFLASASRGQIKVTWRVFGALVRCFATDSPG